MAQPIPISVSLSTTLVQIDTLQNPYTPVLLNAISYPGQLLTVLNTLSTYSVLTSTIVVSTTNDSFFAKNVYLTNSSFSTLLQQPNAFLTVQASLPNQWNVLNSYPFRDQYISAGVQVLTTSTLYARAVSTIQDYTSSLFVENLRVSGNFFQSSGLVLNTNVSSLGAVVLLSTLTVLGNVYFSSQVSSLGFTRFGSTLSVGKDFYSFSTLQFNSTLTISTSLSVVGTLSAPTFLLQSSLQAPTLNVLSTSPIVANIGDSIRIQGSLQSLSSVFVGGDASLQRLNVRSGFSSLSSMWVSGDIRLLSSVFIGKELTVLGSLSVGTTLTILGPTRFESTVVGSSNAIFLQDLYVLSSLSTTVLSVNKGTIFGNLHASPSTVVSTQELVVRGSLGFGSLFAVSTSVGGNVSTYLDFVGRSTIRLDSDLTVANTFSTLKNLSVSQDVYIYGDAVFGNNVSVSSGLHLYDSLDTLSSMFLQTPIGLSTVVHSNVFVLGSVYATDTVILSSIVLASNAVAFDFTVSTIKAEYQGIVSSVSISSLFTSSLTVGDLQRAEFTMDMTTVLQTWNLSTFFLSTLFLDVGTNAVPSTFFQTTSSFGVGIYASTNTMDVDTVAYTIGNTYAGKNVSSLSIQGTVVKGAFFGDGSLLQNVNFPEGVSTFFLSTGSLVVEKVQVSSCVVSAGLITDGFELYSTLQVGDFSIFGTAAADPLVSYNYMGAASSDVKTLFLNNMTFFGDTAGDVPKQVVINSNILPSLNSNYKVGVGGAFRINEVESPNLILELNTYYGNVITARDIGVLSANILYVDSGIIGTGNGTLFIPEGYKPIQASTNTLQPVLSTLVFNSTLFVNRELQKVGINTDPFYTLDVRSNARISKDLIANSSTVLNTTLFINQAVSSIWFAAVSSVNVSNLYVSSNEGTTWNPATNSNPLQGSQAFCVGYDGGTVSLTGSSLDSVKRWVAGGTSLLQYYDPQNGFWQQGLRQGGIFFPSSNNAVAYNGYVWVAVGENPSSLLTSSYPTVLWSEDGKTWNAPTMGGFGWDGVSATYGGRSVAWNGSLWVAVGRGNSSQNSIIYSVDGKSWNDINTTSLTNPLNGVAWTGSNWVAVEEGESLTNFLLSTDGSNWTVNANFGFVGGGYAVASDGTTTVAVGTNTPFSVSASIQYSLDDGNTWFNASGTLFTDTGDAGKTVVWNGNYWLAGGLSGIRKSYDGRTWFQPGGSPSFRFNGLGYSSNAQPTLQFGASNYVLTGQVLDINQIRFYNTPGPNVTTRDKTPSIAYSPSSLSFVNTMVIDEYKNVGILTYPSSVFRSTFYVNNLASVSSFVSSHSVQVAALYLSLANV